MARFVEPVKSFCVFKEKTGHAPPKDIRGATHKNLPINIDRVEAFELDSFESADKQPMYRITFYGIYVNRHTLYSWIYSDEEQAKVSYQYLLEAGGNE